MNKKVLFICFILLCFCGCGNISSVVDNDEVSKPIKVVSKTGETVANCFTDESEFSIVFKDGQVVRYYDSVDGELVGDAINIINTEYLVGVTEDDRAISIMNSVMTELGGYCEKEK